MKRLSIVFLAAVLLLSPAAYAENTAKRGTDPVPTPEQTEAIRDQKLLVPTAKGVQQATQSEAERYETLMGKDLEAMTSSYIVGDYRSGKVLEAYNVDEVHAIASMSKLVGLYVILDDIKAGNTRLDEMVTIDHEAASMTGSSYKLKEGEVMSVKQLITAAFVISGNDAITALGKHVSGSSEAFVAAMNAKCEALGLTGAHMVNATGLTDYADTTYNEMSTRELFTLVRSMINTYPEILDYTQIKSLIEPERSVEEYNTNPLLGIVKGVDGLKTGYTNAAGRCLVATALKPGEGEALDTRLIVITTGSPNDFTRYVAARKLMEHALDTYQYTVIGTPDQAVGQVTVENAIDEKVDVYETSTSNVLWDSKSKVTKTLHLKKNLTAPIPAGAVVGTISYSMNDEEVYKQDLIVKDRVLQQGFIYKIQDLYSDIIKNIERAA